MIILGMIFTFFMLLVEYALTVAAVIVSAAGVAVVVPP